MSKRKRRNCTQVPKEENQTSAGAEGGGDQAVRTPDGRFAPGHCPNPTGRPPKPQTGVVDVITQVMAEMIRDETPGSSRHLSVAEALMRSLCYAALKDHDYKVAFALLKLAIPAAQAAKPSDEPAHEEEAGEILDRFVERALRQKALREAANNDVNDKKSDPDHPNEEDDDS